MPRPVRVAAVCALAAIAATGCGGAGRNLYEREMVVRFSTGATTAQQNHVRSACSGIPGTRAEAPTHSKLLSDQLSNVRFRVDKASDAQLAQLTDCLSKQPGVIGVTMVDNVQ